MQGIINYFNQYEWFGQYLDYVLHMSSTELFLFIVITSILVLFIFYRWFGIGGLTAMVVFIFLMFVIMKADLYGVYLERQYDNELREEILQRELSKDNPTKEVGGSVGAPLDN